MSGPATVGWCPGALRPMASGDGLLLRVKPRGGCLTLDQAAALAKLSQEFGNSHLDLTGRANLQIRGARPDTLQPLWAGLREAGLLDREAEDEALRNIVASPLAGLDPDCFDTRPFLSALEAALTRHRDVGTGRQPDSEACGRSEPPTTGTGGSESSHLTLPAKWSFLIDGGGRLPLADVTADMRFRFDREGGMRIGLDAVWAEPLATRFDLPQLLAAAAALVAAQSVPMRMKTLLAELGQGPVFAALGLQPAAGRDLRPDPAGVGAFSADIPGVVGFAPPFGDLPATLFDAIVAACRAAGGSGLRLTPWRAILATGIADRTTLRQQLDSMALILRADDPRGGVSTCVGAPACHRATTPTRADAALLAARLGRNLDGIVHLTGCAKGCGRPADASWTLVGRQGRYDLFRGREAAAQAAGLSSTAAANWLSRAGRVRVS